MKTNVLNMGDFSASLAVYRTSAKDFPGLSEESFSAALAHNLRRGTVLGADCGGQITGILIFSPPLSRISFLAVCPAFRRRGVGRALIEAALVRLGGTAELLTYAPEDPRAPGAAYRLYRSLGFAEAGAVPGYEKAVVLMRKSN